MVCTCFLLARSDPDISPSRTTMWLWHTDQPVWTQLFWMKTCQVKEYFQWKICISEIINYARYSKLDALPQRLWQNQVSFLEQLTHDHKLGTFHSKALLLWTILPLCKLLPCRSPDSRPLQSHSSRVTSWLRSPPSSWDLQAFPQNTEYSGSGWWPTACSTTRLTQTNTWCIQLYMSVLSIPLIKRKSAKILTMEAKTVKTRKRRSQAKNRDLRQSWVYGKKAWIRE